METQSGDGVLEEFRIEFLDCWRKLPNKFFFFALLAVWLAVFHYLGNSTLGYIRSPSLFHWLYASYSEGDTGLMASEEGYSVLIPPLVILLLWLKRRELLALKPGLWGPGLAVIGLSTGLHILGYMVQQPRISVIAMFTGIYGLMGLAWGLPWLRASFFPFILFLFCIPLGSLAVPITFRLRLLVCQLVELVSHYILAIDVIRDGTALRDPGNHYQYDVAAACSGIRSLIATLALAVVLGFISFRKWWKRGLVIASAFPLAVLGNLLRLLAIIVAAEIGGQSAGNAVHEGGPLGIWSLLPYVPAFLGLLALERYLGDRPPATEPHLPAAPATAT